MKTLAQWKPFETRGRFSIEKESNWCIIDWHTGKLVGFDTKTEAQDNIKFVRQYVKKHGDIDLGSFPWDINTPMRYEDDPSDDRPWRIIHGKVVNAESRNQD
jgi:hypothetical protein